MILRIINYYLFGRGEKPELAQSKLYLRSAA